MITRIRFDARDAAGRGLKTVELRGLGPLVVFAGPNGGGKTRHLELIHDAVRPHAEGTYDHEIDDSTGGEWLHAVLLRYVPGAMQHNPESIFQNKCDNLLRDIRGGSYSAVASGLHVYLEATARALWNHDHPRSGQFPDVMTDYTVAQRFNEVIERLLGTIVEPRPDTSARVIPLLFGRPYQPQLLSVGQIVLLCWAVLLVSQGAHYKGKIVLLDEPEVYLHPDICIHAIKSLQELLGRDGQVWVATHSLPLIAWAGADSLYFVEGGNAVYARSTPSMVWRSLLGGEQSREDLITFLDGDVDAVAVRFAAECLLGPGVASERSNDPQANQLGTAIAAKGPRMNNRIGSVGLLRAPGGSILAPSVIYRRGERRRPQEAGR